MQEYFTEAVVLDKEPNGDLDSRVFLFTKNFGRLTAKTKSSRKITSKLSGHLEPGNFIQARLVEKNGLQIVDALKKSHLAVKPSDFYFLNQLFAEAEPDSNIWQQLLTSEFNWRKILKILGWGPESAVCANCGKSPVKTFNVKSQEFFCSSCSSKIPQNGVIYF